MSIDQYADAFRKAVLNFYQSNHALKGVKNDAARMHLDHVIDAIANPLAVDLSHEASRINANRFWDGLIANADSGFSDIAEAASFIEPFLKWQISASYIGVFDDHFLQNKAYTEIIGPNGLLISETCRVGFLILGPDIYYPPHNHEATELYHTLSGQGAWQQGDAVEQIKSNDIAIFHDEWESHAMRTQKPILTLWSWAGAINSPPQPL